MSDKEDLVNNPSHYASEKITVTYEPIQFCCLFGFSLGNAFKYLFRRKHKGNELQDLQKARYYLERAMCEDFHITDAALKTIDANIEQKRLVDEFIKRKDFLQGFFLGMTSIRNVLEFTEREIRRINVANRLIEKKLAA